MLVEIVSKTKKYVFVGAAKAIHKKMLNRRPHSGDFRTIRFAGILIFTCFRVDFLVPFGVYFGM